MDKRKNSGFFFSVLLCIVLSGCARNELAPAEYEAWYVEEKKSLQAEKQVGELKFELQYRPADHVLLLDTKNMQLSAAELEARRRELAGLQHFTLRLSAEGHTDDLLKFRLSNAGEYASRVEYFAFGLQKELKLVEDGDTLPCVLFQYERTFGVSPYSTFVLAFPAREPKKKSAQDKTLIYNDVIFGSGPVKLTVRGERIDEVPQLTLK